MAMDDRVVLVGGPFNDECVEVKDAADVFLITFLDQFGLTHYYSLDLDQAAAAIYNYVGTAPPA